MKNELNENNLFKKQLLLELFKKTKDIVDVKTLLPYYEHVNTILVNKEYDFCNDILIEIDIENSSDILLVGMLRLTFLYKNHIECWYDFLNKVEKKLISNNLDSQKILNGLL